MQAASPTALNLGSYPAWGTFAVAALAFLGVLARQFVPFLKQRDDSDMSLRADLLARIAKVESDSAALIAKLEEKLEQQRSSYETKLELERATHAAEQSVMRHRMNNLDQCLTMILTLIEQNPDRAQQAAARVREMREKQEQSEATEKATIHAAKIGANKDRPATA